MVNPDYQAQQTLLASVDYLDTIQKRDDIFKKIKNLNNFNPKFLDESIIEVREKIFQDIKLLDEEVNLRRKNFESLQMVADMYAVKKEEDIKQAKKDEYKDIQDIELRKRKFQILQYQNYLNDETKHLLWVLFVVLLIDCFIILGNLLKIPGFEKSTVFALIFGTLAIYGIYLFKKLVVDNVNIDIYHIDRHNYKKPTDAELTRDKQLKDKLSALRDQSTGNDCPGQDSIYQTDIKFDEDLVAQEIEEQGKATTKDGQQCLRMTV